MNSAEGLPDHRQSSSSCLALSAPGGGEGDERTGQAGVRGVGGEYEGGGGRGVRGYMRKGGERVGRGRGGQEEGGCLALSAPPVGERGGVGRGEKV